MSPSRNPQDLKPQSPQPFMEIPRMPFTLNRFLDVAVSVLIVFIATLTAGATACLGA